MMFSCDLNNGVHHHLLGAPPRDSRAEAAAQKRLSCQTLAVAGFDVTSGSGAACVGDPRPTMVLADGVDLVEGDRRVLVARWHELSFDSTDIPRRRGREKRTLAFPSTSWLADGFRRPEWLGPVRRLHFFFQFCTPVWHPDV